MSNTNKMNELEELGRVDAEKAYTEKGKENLKAEKKRVVRELKSGGGTAGQVVKTITSPVTHLRNIISAKVFKGKPKLAKKGWK